MEFNKKIQNKKEDIKNSEACTYCGKKFSWHFAMRIRSMSLRLPTATWIFQTLL